MVTERCRQCGVTFKAHLRRAKKHTLPPTKVRKTKGQVAKLKASA